MVILSIQRMGLRGVIQFVGSNGANAMEFDARLSDDEVMRLLPKEDQEVKPSSKAEKPKRKNAVGKGKR